MLDEFKKFALRGNVVDLAVGVIIGVAFGAIVASVVGDIVMPVIGAVTGGLDFSNYYIPLSSAVPPGPDVPDRGDGRQFHYGRPELFDRRFRSVCRHSGDQQDEERGSDGTVSRSGSYSD